MTAACPGGTSQQSSFDGPCQTVMVVVGLIRYRTSVYPLFSHLLFQANAEETALRTGMVFACSMCVNLCEVLCLPLGQFVRY